MPVQFKFRGEKSFRGLLNVTTPCTLQRVKNAIYEQARISDQTTDLALEDPGTGGVLAARKLLVQDALVQVIVRRTPVQGRVATVTTLVAVNDGLDAEGREEDMAIDRMVDQHDVENDMIAPGSAPEVTRYSRSYRLAATSQARKREGYDLGDSDDENLVMQDVEPPPPNYTCHRCGTTGGKQESHWIWDCPTNDDPDHMKKVRTARGVPRHWLRKVASIEEGQALSAGGVTFTLPGMSGHYIIDHKASEEDRKLRAGDTVQEKVTTAFSKGATRVEESLKCPLCHQLFRQAVLAPCCGATFCSDCVIDRLAHSSIENGTCPGCGKEVLAHQLVANEDIRKQVAKISRASTVAAIAQEKVNARPGALQLDASIKDRVNRPRKHAEEAARGTLALTDGTVAFPAHGLGATWQPLGMGAPLLTPEQFVAWQGAVRRAAAPSDFAAARDQFSAWQQGKLATLATAAAPSGPAPVVPSKASFEEWQRMLKAGGDRPTMPP